MISGALAREIRGETLLLHPDRALSWPSRRLLIVADTHFGKSSVFGRHGIAVPDGADAEDRRRIDALLQSTRSERLLVLGDFLHGRVAPDSTAAVELARWIRGLPAQLLLVTGNHDRTAQAGWRPEADWEGDDLHEGPFNFTHDADAAESSSDSFLIGGHVHPVISLSALRKRRAGIPVFWERPHSMVLPSFGLFTGGYRISPREGGRVYAAGAESVVELRWGM